MVDAKDVLRSMMGQNVMVHTWHKLFGEQTLEIKDFKPMTKGCAGFYAGGQQIYIRDDDVIDTYTTDTKVIIHGKIFTITIEKTIDKL